MTESKPNIGSKETSTTSDNTESADTPSTAPSPSKRNAFSELMSSRPHKMSKATSTTDSSSSKSASTPATPISSTSATSGFYNRHSNRPASDPRSGLLAYIQRPESFPPSIVVNTTPHTVLIRDRYPKATVHLLLLPRSPQHYNLHPHDAFNKDLAFLALMRSECAKATTLALSELSRLISPSSRTSRARIEAMKRDPAPSPCELPPGRDLSQEIRVGVHAHPSMSHLHIHIISRDMHSDSLKHRKHYNSFNTDFFIPLADYPLADNDPRMDTRHQNDNLRRDFVCWRCGRGFGNKFKQLKEHLDVEFAEWKEI